ncbi:hypothetical protein V5F23_09880 [Pseudomonas sp. WP18]|uniref:Uncharacterized protein n=1 Tax=Pseudomonas brassicacearum TaxID=930166 RepID=A0A423GDH0_9PSED|nr:hypothetical protein [Pseudomonas brassicacearum]ROM84883.1 hypothetical protein BK652_09895 [Pseudomonas brassicacearum]
MSKDGMLDPLEGLNSPIGLGTLAVTLALTKAVQQLAGKDSEVVERALKAALETEIFKNAEPDVRKNFEAPIHQALKTAAETRALIKPGSQS